MRDRPINERFWIVDYTLDFIYPDGENTLRVGTAALLIGVKKVYMSFP